MRNDKGLAPLVIVAIVAAGLVVVSVGGYFGWRALKGGPDEGAPAEEISEPELDWEAPQGFDLAEGSGLHEGALPDLSVGGDIDLDLPAMDFSGLAGETTSFEPPEASVDAPPVPSLSENLNFNFSGMGAAFGAQAAPSSEQPASPPAQEPSSPPAQEPSAPPAQSEANLSNCAPFASMPSSQYCSAVGDPQGLDLCERCKASGY